jgi:hypothetical protein
MATAHPLLIKPQMKTPPAPEDTDGVFHAFTSGKVAALEPGTHRQWVRSGISSHFLSIPSGAVRLFWRDPPKPSQTPGVVL